MTQHQLTRRRYGTAVLTGLAVGLAGCTGGPDGDDDETDEDESLEEDTGDDDGNDNAPDDTDDSDSEEESENDDEDDGDDTSAEYGPVAQLTVVLENEDGEPVSEGVEIVIQHTEESYGHAIIEGISNGSISVDLFEEGEYTVSVESLEEEFDTVEDDVTVEEDEEAEIGFVLEGAPNEEESEADDTDGDADGDGEEDGDEAEE